MPTVSYFNSHARVGRDVMPHVPVAQGSDFNSHARVGRDVRRHRCRQTVWISTHTPAWGVTFVCIWNVPVSGISTHTPAWGVTQSRLPDHRPDHHFNSHARVGRDFRLMPDAVPNASISTHTPAWGVTTIGRGILRIQAISTHTPAWGVTVFGILCVEPWQISTHTPAWGVTTHCVDGTTMLNISTHTPAWGVTPLIIFPSVT